MLRRAYNWVTAWSETPYGSWALFLLAFAEFSFIRRSFRFFVVSELIFWRGVSEAGRGSAHHLNLHREILGLVGLQLSRHVSA